MIFAIDVKRRVVEKHDRFIDAVDLRSRIEIIKEEETNADVIDILNKMHQLADDLIEFKKDALRREMKAFEKEFVADILSNELYYREVIRQSKE